VRGFLSIVREKIEHKIEWLERCVYNSAVSQVCFFFWAVQTELIQILFSVLPLLSYKETIPRDLFADNTLSLT